MAVALQSPHDELEELEAAFGTRQAVADLLGKQRPQVARWLIEKPAIQERHRRLINDSWTVVQLLHSLGVNDADALRHTLLGRSPTLGFRRPAELIWEGETEKLIETLNPEIGDAARDRLGGPALVPHVGERADAASWKTELQRELAESLTGGRLHEAFAFLVALTAEQREAFAAAAGQALAEAGSEQDFDAFLEPYWQQLAATHRDAPAAIIEPVADEQPSDREFTIDDLLIPDGGMSSRRFASR